jgi:hypothetical protein
MTERFLYSPDIADHFLVDQATAQHWFRSGTIKEADNADRISAQWVTTNSNVLRAIGIDPVGLDADARDRLMEPPVTADELAWLLSSQAKNVSPAAARRRMRRFLCFKMPGSKLLYAHRFDVERSLNRATDRARFLAENPAGRKPGKKNAKTGF